jgi:hypothetical protein
VALILAVCFSLAATAAAQDDTPPPAVGVTQVVHPDGRVITAVVPGPLLSAVAPGDGALILLVGDEQPDAPNRLYRLRVPADGGAPELTLVRSDLQGGAAILEAVDLDGDGVYEVLFGVPGNLYSLGHPQRGDASGSPPPWVHLLAEKHYDPRARPGRLLRGPTASGTLYASAEVGAVTVYRLGGAGQGAAEVARYPLPVRVTSTDVGLYLTSEAVRWIERPGAAPLVVSGPEEQGRQRLRTILVDPLLPPEADGAVEEAWSMLPAAERVEQSWYAWIGKRPVLIVAAQSADKMGLFEKKRLRVFPLRADRTRSGKRAVLDVVTENLRWYPMRVEVGDFDGDGLEDLATIQSKGLGGGKLHLEAFLSTPAGRFQPRTLSNTEELDFTAADFGRDLTGDGRADLVAAERSAVLVYAGESAKRRLVEKKPRWTVPIGELEGETEVTLRVGDEGGSVEQKPPSWDELVTLDLDLDQDLAAGGTGRAEAVLLEASLRGRGVVTVVRFPE